jgi:hypothetical protein
MVEPYIAIRDPRTFGDLAKAQSTRWQATCSFCKQHKHGCLKYSTRRSICAQCLEARAGELLPHIAKSESQARTLARKFVKGFVEQRTDPAHWISIGPSADTVLQEARSIHRITDCSERYARECIDSQVGKLRRSKQS